MTPERFIKIASIFILVICWSPFAGATNGIEDIGVSTQARGRGGADVAVGDTSLSQVDNPATLSLQDGPRFDFSGNLVLIRDHWQNQVDGVNSSIGLVPLIDFAQSNPIDEQWSWGWALDTKSGLATKFRRFHLLIPTHTVSDRSNFEDLSIPLNVGYKLTDKLSLGAGVRGEVASAKFNTVIGPADFNIERGYAFGGGFQAGLFYQALDNLTFGVGYRSPTWFGDMEAGHAAISPLASPATVVDLGEASIPDFRLPQRVSVGAAWDVLPRIKLVNELRWLNYSNSSFHSATIEQSGIPGLLPSHLPFPLGYRDQWVVATGAEFKVNCHWKWGVGYNYGTEPVAASNLLPIADAFTQHHVTTGLRYETESWWVGCGYILGVTAGLSGNGISAFPAPNDFATSNLSMTQHSIFFGFGFCR